MNRHYFPNRSAWIRIIRTLSIPNTTIRYQLPRRSQVSLIIYNLLGQEIRRLVNSELTAGEYRVEWDGTDDGGRAVSTGIYFYRLEVGSVAQTRKMLLVK